MSCLINNAMKLESIISGNENGNNLCLTGLELFSYVGGLSDGLLVLGVEIWVLSC